MFRFLARCLLLGLLPMLPILLAGCGSNSDDTPAAEDEAAASSAAAEETAEATLTGNWIGEFGTGIAFSMGLTQTGDAVTGTYATGAFDGTVSGTITGNAVELTVAIPGGATSIFSGSVNDARTTMSGTFNIVAGGGGSGTWSATK